MSKDVSAIVSGMGVGMSILTSLMEKARRKGLSDEDFHRLATPEGDLILDRFVAFMAEGKSVVQKFACKVVAMFSITCVGIPTSELVKKGSYDWVNGDITDERFPIKIHASVTRKIELIEFCEHDPSSDEVLAELKRLGLERPTYEDALEFGPEYPEEQRKRPIVFLHEPVRGSLGSLLVLVLGGSGGERLLRLRWFDGGWPRGCVFAGVRK